MAHKRPPPPWIHPCAYPGFKPQSLKSMLRLISIGLTKLKVKYVLKDFDQDFNHLTAKEFSTLNLNEKGFLFKKKRKEKRNMEIRKAVLCHVCSLIISSNSQWEQGNKNKEKKIKKAWNTNTSLSQTTTKYKMLICNSSEFHVSIS